MLVQVKGAAESLALLAEIAPEELEIRARYRIVTEPSPRIEWLHHGEWVVVYYCSSEAGAKACLERVVAKSLEWERLSEDERRRRILR